MTARYSHPSPVRRQVMSPTMRVQGLCAVESRPIRSGRDTGSLPGMVVGL